LRATTRIELMQFFKNYILQSSVATRLRCCETFNDSFVAHIGLVNVVKSLRIS